jgi:DNA-directed RNA polymerase subunit F
MAEYSLSITGIFLSFLKEIRGMVHKSVNEVNSIIRSRKDIIEKTPEALKGHIVYDIDKHAIKHFYPINSKTKKNLSRLINEITSILKDEELYYDTKVANNIVVWPSMSLPA